MSDENPEAARILTGGETKRFKAAGGQVLTATHVNPGQQYLTLIHPGWLGDGEHANTKLQLNLLAQQDPSTTYAYVNMPGMRGSEALPPSVMREMVRTGSFEAYGEEIAAAFALYKFPVAMSKAGLEGDLAKATQRLTADHSVTLVSPEMSALNMPGHVAEIMRRVSLCTDAELIHYIIG